MNFFYNFYFFTPEIFIITNLFILLLFGVFYSVNKNYGLPIIFKSLGFVILQLFIFTLLLAFNQEPHLVFLFNKFFLSDYFTYYARLILLVSVILWFMVSLNYEDTNKINIFEFWILILLAIVAFSFLLHAFDLTTIYLSIEFQSLIFYILASLNRTSEFSTEAGLKYFVLGAFASAFLLFGFTILYGFTGLTNLQDFCKFFSSTISYDFITMHGILISIFFITIAILFKLNIAPFHFWAPDVYEGSNTIITAFFATLPKIALFSVLIKILVFVAHDLILPWRNLIILCCLISSVVGTLGALNQTKWKRFVAYSSISHMSFLLLALITGDTDSLNSIFFYLIIYIFSTFFFFSIILNFKIIQFPKIYQLRYIFNIQGLNRNNPFLAFCLLITMFSMAGVPPLAGFFAKFFTIFSALKANSYGLPIFLLSLNCVASFYYLRFIKTMYFDETTKILIFQPMDKLNAVLSSISLIFLVFIFFDIEFTLIITKLMTSCFIK